MSLEKIDGRWVGDFRYKGFPRLRISMGTAKKSEADARHDAVAKLFRQNRRDLIEQLRLPKGHAQKLTPERLAEMVEHHEPLAPLPAPVPEFPAASGSDHTWGTVDQVTERYLAWLELHPKKELQTFTAARAQLRRFARFEHAGRRVGDLPLEAVTSEIVESYQRSMLAAKTPANTVTGYMTRVGALWNWQAKQERKAAQDEHRMPRAVFSPIDPEMMVRDTTARQRYLTQEEAERLLAATPQPLLAMVGLALLAGLRRGEAQHLGVQDIDLAIGILSIHEHGLPDGTRWKPKTKRSIRSVPITAELRSLIEQQRGDGASDLWLTPRRTDPAWPIHERPFTVAFREIVIRAGLPHGRKDPNGVTFHTLRHTFASWLAMKGVDLYTIAQLMGDTLATIEKTYAKLSPDFKRAAMAKLAGAVRLPPTDTATATETGVYVK